MKLISVHIPTKDILWICPTYKNQASLINPARQINSMSKQQTAWVLDAKTAVEFCTWKQLCRDSVNSVCHNTSQLQTAWILCLKTGRLQIAWIMCIKIVCLCVIIKTIKYVSIKTRKFKNLKMLLKGNVILNVY